MAEEEARGGPTGEPKSGGMPPALPPTLPAVAAAESSPDSAPEPHRGLLGRIRTWFVEEGPWWLCSFVFHIILVCSLALLGGRAIEKVAGEAPSFEEAKVEPTAIAPEKIERFDIGDALEDPTELNADALNLQQPARLAQEAEFNDQSEHFEHRGGGTPSDSKQANVGGFGGFDIQDIGAGPSVKGKGGVGVGIGTGTHAGVGGSGWGFGGRGSGSRKAMLASGGGTKQSELAVLAALNWIARHQLSDGSWSLSGYKSRCKDNTCTGPGKTGDRSAAATALGLLPFLGAGQTHESKGRYKNTVAAGIRFLLSNEKANGDLRIGGDMYDQGLAAIALCECYGMSNAKDIKRAAQAALNFIMEAQNQRDGGWRYQPTQPGDLSVSGWQIMALKSGQMAYLNVTPAALDNARKFLKAASFDGRGGGRFSYRPGNEFCDGIVIHEGEVVKNDDSQRAVTAIGLLCQEYMHMPRNDPAMVEGTAYLMKSLPDTGARNVYYWYYATQVMHNQMGGDWDVWNRKMRHILISTQNKEGCATGSWDPHKPVTDTWGDIGGRLMITSLSALTLEVYYRFLPLYKLDEEVRDTPPAAASAKPEKK
jgi:hypothetical protein